MKGEQGEQGTASRPIIFPPKAFPSTTSTSSLSSIFPSRKDLTVDIDQLSNEQDWWEDGTFPSLDTILSNQKLRPLLTHLFAAAEHQLGFRLNYATKSLHAATLQCQGPLNLPPNKDLAGNNRRCPFRIKVSFNNPDWTAEDSGGHTHSHSMVERVSAEESVRRSSNLGTRDKGKGKEKQKVESSSSSSDDTSEDSDDSNETPETTGSTTLPESRRISQKRSRRQSSSPPPPPPAKRKRGRPSNQSQLDVIVRQPSYHSEAEEEEENEVKEKEENKTISDSSSDSSDTTSAGSASPPPLPLSFINRLSIFLNALHPRLQHFSQLFLDHGIRNAFDLDELLNDVEVRERVLEGLEKKTKALAGDDPDGVWWGIDSARFNAGIDRMKLAVKGKKQLTEG